MLAVIFELEPHADKVQDYLDLAAELSPEVRKIDGFISIERFQSLTQPGKYVSISFWRDQDAIEAWRNLEQHRAAQAAGRRDIFKDYRLCVTDILRDYGLHERAAAPADSQARHR